MLLSRALLLKDQPAGSLHTLDELFALANAMEREAASRYDQLAADMKEQGKEDLAIVFAELADAEREHVDSVTRWSQSRLGKVPDPAIAGWQAVETFDPDATIELKASRLMTPYHALAMAVQNEERAFAFWSYMAAFAEDQDIKTAAEAMAREELEHIATLRKQRRRAYHRERPHQSDKRGAGGADDDAMGRVDARTLELRLAGQLDDLDRTNPAAADRLHELHKETLRMSDETAGIGSFPAGLARRDAQAIAEALADAYLEEAEKAGDQARVDLLQQLAMKAIARLAWLRSIA